MTRDCNNCKHSDRTYSPKHTAAGWLYCLAHSSGNIEAYATPNLHIECKKFEPKEDEK